MSKSKIKKILGGGICFDSATPFLVGAAILVAIWLFFKNYTITPITLTTHSETSSEINSEKIVIVNNQPKTDNFNDLYYPPLKTNSYLFPPVTADIRPLPQIESPTRGYTQIGIITRNEEGGKETLILPLMGRVLNSRRDKWQYYTVSNTGSVNSKLPIKFKGRNGLSETGCDEILNGDTVYVEGYKEIFTATVYENATYSYNPL